MLNTVVVVEEIAASSSRNYILVKVVVDIIIREVLVDASLKSFSYFITFFFSIPSWLIVSFLTHEAHPSVITVMII